MAISTEHGSLTITCASGDGTMLEIEPPRDFGDSPFFRIEFTPEFADLHAADPEIWPGENVTQMDAGEVLALGHWLVASATEVLRLHADARREIEEIKARQRMEARLRGESPVVGF